MKEQTSCPTEDPTPLVLQGQGLARDWPGTDPSCQSRHGLSRKQEGNRNHTTLGRIGNTPYSRSGLAVDDRKRYIGTLEATPNRRPR